MKTTAPKDQIERYTNPGMTHFKGDKPNALIPWHFRSNMGKHVVGHTVAEASVEESKKTQELRGDVHEPFKEWSRGKATEIR